MSDKLKYKRGARITLLILAGLTGLSIWLASNLGFDYNFENFFPKNDPETDFFSEFRHNFESDNDFVIVGLQNNEGIFQTDFLARVDSIASVLGELADVDTVITPTKFQTVYKDPVGGFHSIPLLKRASETALKKDSANIWDQGEMVGSIFSENGKAICLQVKHKQYLSKLDCDTLAVRMQDVVYNANFDEAHVVGRAVGQSYYVNMMQTELTIFVSLGILLIVLFLFIAFRSAWGIWVPITVVLLSVVWILGIMKLCGKQIDLMLIVLPTIIFVVGMSDVVHVLSKYFEELRKGIPKYEAIKISFKEIGLATFLTSLTTAIGFLTLLTSSITPIADFGVYTAIGVFVAYILAYSLLPAVLILSKAPAISDQKQEKLFWTRQLRKGFLFTMRNRKMILFGSFIVIVVSSIGMSRIKVNNFILEDLREGDALKQEFVYFEENFSGGRPFEMAILLNDSVSVFDLEVLNDLDRLDQFLINEYKVGTLISPSVMIKLGNRQLNGNTPDSYSIPSSQKEVNRILKLVERFDADSMLRLFVNEEKQMARYSGKVGDYGAIYFNKENEELQTFLQEELPNRKFDLRVTGTANLIDHNNKTLAVDMIGGLVIAFFVVAIIVGIMFKNIKMVVICLIPNFLPLLMIAGIMGFMGIDLKVSTSIIFTIAFGIAVDDTIHFMSKLRLQLAQGRSVLYAVKRTYFSTGKAIIITSIILCGGFLTLILSEFLGTYYIGLLISLTLLFAVLADLMLLPVLITYFYQTKKPVITKIEDA
ncbi:MAG: putative RND superfamily exporter protein [Flavobacteriales bacterium]|jgi:predicted RND superfamily exporter protein